MMSLMIVQKVMMFFCDSTGHKSVQFNSIQFGFSYIALLTTDIGQKSQDFVVILYPLYNNHFIYRDVFSRQST